MTRPVKMHRAEHYAQALLALAAWQRFAQHAADRQWTIPLWGALLWDEAITATEKVLGGDASCRGARASAGRKPKPDAMPMRAFVLRADQVGLIEAQAKRVGLSRSEWLRLLLDLYAEVLRH